MKVPLNLARNTAMITERREKLLAISHKLLACSYNKAEEYIISGL